MTSRPLDILVSVDRTRPFTLGRQIEDQLRQAIRDDTLRPGARLPSTRDLARELGVSRPIVVEAYAQLAGPYNRRNVYGAVVAYGPVLATDARTRPLFEAVATHVLCGERPLLRELGIDPATVSGPVRLRLEPRPGTNPNHLPTVLEVACA